MDALSQLVYKIATVMIIISTLFKQPQKCQHSIARLVTRQILACIYVLLISSTDITNNFVAVTINLMSGAVICTFLNQRGGGSSSAIKSCSIVYNQSETCEVDDMLRLSPIRQIAQDRSDVVTIGLPFVNRLRGSRGSYCFVVNATNGTYTAMVRGTFDTGIVFI